MPENYGEIARLLCDHYSPAWVDAVMTCHLLIWGNKPGFPKFSQTLHDWSAAGAIASTFAKALAGQQEPSVAAAGADPDPYAHLKPWVAAKKRKLAENIAKCDALLAQHHNQNQPEPKGAAS
jgi:hypothetical protein